MRRKRMETQAQTHLGLADSVFVSHKLAQVVLVCQPQHRKVTASFLTWLLPPAEKPVPSRRSSTRPGRILSFSTFPSF